MHTEPDSLVIEISDVIAIPKRSSIAVVGRITQGAWPAAMRDRTLHCPENGSIWRFAGLGSLEPANPNPDWHYESFMLRHIDGASLEAGMTLSLQPAA
jgi:hypothetical protein